MNVTKIPLPDNTHVMVCNDCGAYADTANDITHYLTCTPTDMSADNFNANEMEGVELV